MAPGAHERDLDRFGTTLYAQVNLHLCMLDGVVAQADKTCEQRVQVAVRGWVPLIAYIIESAMARQRLEYVCEPTPSPVIASALATGGG